MKAIQIKTSDLYPISAHLFHPEKPNGKLLLINSATGVKQHVYFSFAEYFSENDFTVVTYDYRGIGTSKPKKMKGFAASMRTWGTKDFVAVTDFIKTHFPDFEKYVLGHSVGALILGMNEDSKMFKELIFVATQKAYIRNLRFRTKIEACLGFGIVQPVITKILGYFPAHRFGLGESLPAESASDWRILILNRKSTNKLLEKIPNCATQLSQNVFILQIEDDQWVTQKGIATLLAETYPNLKPEIREVKVSESEAGKIGHINYFRSYNKKLWNIILEKISL